MAQPVVHFEIGCRDQQASTSFYRQLFDWQIVQAGPAATIMAQAPGIGGHFTSLGHEPHNYVLVYVEVDDIAAYLKKGEELGGKTVVPAVDIPGQGSFAWLRDPEGTIVGLWKPATASA